MMPAPSSAWRSLLPLLAIASLASANLRLPEVQSIVGFSTSCFNAYNTRLPDCSLADFLGSVGGRNVGCSVSCVSQLSQLQPVVQASCQGERAGRDTVIGQMFLGTVTNFLCGNDVGDGEAASTTAPGTSMSSATTSMSTVAPADPTTTSETSTIESSTTASSTSSSTTTAAPSSSLSTTEGSSTSTAQATPSAGANRGGQGDTQTTFGGSGGGSPFDGGPGEFDSAASSLPLQHSTITLLSAAVCMLLIG